MDKMGRVIHLDQRERLKELEGCIKWSGKCIQAYAATLKILDLKLQEEPSYIEYKKTVDRVSKGLRLLLNVEYALREQTRTISNNLLSPTQQINAEGEQQ